MSQNTIIKFLKLAMTKLRQNLDQCYDENGNQNNGLLRLLRSLFIELDCHVMTQMIQIKLREFLKVIPTLYYDCLPPNCQFLFGLLIITQ